MKKCLLLMTMGLLAASGLNAQASYTTSELPPEGGTFYVYNPATKLWLQSNTTEPTGWTTGLNVGTLGIPFIFHNPAESVSYPGYYSWWIDSQFASNGNIDGSGIFDGGLLYLDHNNYENGWDVSSSTADYPQYANGYFIEGGTSGYIFGVSSDAVPKLTTDIDDETTVWQLVSFKDRITADSVNATPENPSDVSYLLKNVTLANNYKPAAWQADEKDLDNGSGVGPVSAIAGGNLGLTAAQSVHEYWSTKAFDYYQVLTGIPNGTYEFSVRGYYRDGSTASRDYPQTFVAANRQEGTENLRAEYYAGTSSAKLMSIIDGAQPDFDANGYNGQLMLDAETPSDYGYVPDNTDCANYVLWRGGYQNAPIKVIVTDGTLRVGVRKSEGVADDWTIFSNFSLKYEGAQISGDVSELVAGLQATIDAANAYTGSVPPALAADYEAAREAANSALTSTDAATINNASNTLTNELTRVKDAAVAYDNLIGIISLAKSVDQGDDADLTAAIDNANNVAQTGTTVDEFNAPQSDLRLAAKNAASVKVQDVFNGEAPADGNFYIYNVGGKRFLQGGSDWGTHVALGQPGIEFTLAANGDGFTINRENGADGRYLNYGGYTDTPNQDVWKFVPVEGKDGVYNIERNGAEGDGTQYILALAPGSITDAGDVDSRNYFATVSTIATDVNDLKSQWKLVSAEQRDQLLATATEEHPQDATYKLQHPGFDKFDNAAGWTDNSVDGGHSVNDGGGRHQDFVYEGWNTANFDLNQTVSGLPAGYYQIRFNGYYRDGSREAEQQKFIDGEAQQQLAYLYIENAGDYELPLVPITEGINKVPGIGWNGPAGWQPDDVWTAAEYFEYGLYLNASAPFQVKEGDNLTFGIEKDNANEQDWIVVDNFQLIYFGASEPTAIKGVTAPASWNADAPVYNIAGQRVNKGYKGIVIQNGKKRVVK